ncbi:OmpA family protein [Flavobacteriales bacterium]|nr:OmpA family protein [Flavobacteriales bacterium]
MIRLRLNITLITIFCLSVLNGCSTHFFIEGSALEEQGAYMESAVLFEKATKGKYQVEAYSKLIPIYTDLNAHESALRSLDSLASIIRLTNEQLFMKAETHMALEQYDSAKYVLSQLEKSPRVITRINSINTIHDRQADSIYYKVREVKITSVSEDSPKIASAALPHRVNNELYFVVESPRLCRQRKGKDTYIDDYTGNRLMDLWKGTIVDTSGFGGSIELISTPMTDINTEFHDGVVAHHSGDSIGILGKTYVRPDETMKEIISRTAGMRRHMPIQLFHTDLMIDSSDKKFWITRDRLPFCEDDYMYAHPALSPDGNTLYFTSDMLGGFGGMDIWKSEKINGTWKSPENLGGVVNTTSDEAFPTMRHNDTLYFSSNGHLGLGGLDIVYATRSNGNEWEKVFDSFPSPINSSRDDFGLQLDPYGVGGIFASDREGIDGLYHFESYNPELILHVETVHESDLSPWPEVDAVLKLLETEFTEEFITDSIGRWTTTVDRGETYIIQCFSSLGYSAKPFDTPEDQTIREITIIIPLQIVIPMGCMDKEALNYDYEAIVEDGSCQYDVPEPEPVVEEKVELVVKDKDDPMLETVPLQILGCTIPHACNFNSNATKNDDSCEYESCLTEIEETVELKEGDIVELKIFWDLDKSNIRESDRSVIIDFANYLKSYPKLQVLLMSYCDIRATHKYNDVLSQNRANSIKIALIEEGIDADRLTSFGASEVFPIIYCDTHASCTEEQHQTNRRSVASILSPGEHVLIHRVKKGDTLYALSKKYDVNFSQIQLWNALERYNMRLGQDILIYLP